MRLFFYFLLEKPLWAFDKFLTQEIQTKILTNSNAFIKSLRNVWRFFSRTQLMISTNFHINLDMKFPKEYLQEFFSDFHTKKYWQSSPTNWFPHLLSPSFANDWPASSLQFSRIQDSAIAPSHSQLGFIDMTQYHVYEAVVTAAHQFQ